MSHAAMTYAKSLSKAPDGSKIKGSAKAVLLLLADWHNDELGFAFPSVRLLADRAGISIRHCRRQLEALESSGVMERIYIQHAEYGGQGPSIYIFPALDTAQTRAKLDESIKKAFRTPRIVMSRIPGYRSPAPGDKCTEVGRADTTGGPGRGCPTKEPLGELLGEHLRERSGELLREHLGVPIRRRSFMNPPTATSAVRVAVSSSQRTQMPEDANTSPANKTNDSLCNLGLAQTAWDRTVEDLGGRPLTFVQQGLGQRDGLTNRTKDWKSFCFPRVEVSLVETNARGGLILLLSSPKPRATLRGLEKYRSQFESALEKFYGREVCLILSKDAGPAIRRV